MQVLREERVRVDEEDRRIQGEELFSFEQSDAKRRRSVDHQAQRGKRDQRERSQREKDSHS